MSFGKKQVLAVFLEPDNVKLVVAERSGSKVTRIYAGQLSFTPEILRDAFIVDAGKFANQIKIALTQRPQLQTVPDVVLVMPPEKTFVKTLESNESVETFLRVLPYFKEELILTSLPQSKDKNASVTQVAFERKLVEEFQQPFLDAGKKISSVVSSASVLAGRFMSKEDYFFLLGFEKSVTAVIVYSGKISQVESWPADVFATRFTEFVRAQSAPATPDGKIGTIKTAKIAGTVASDVLGKLQADLGIASNAVEQGDIYDLIIASAESKDGGVKISLSDLSGLPSSKFIPFAAAIVVGAVLTLGIINFFKKPSPPQTLSPVGSPKTKVSPTPTATPVPAKPADFKVRVLNGTLLTGEAGRLGEKLTALGFDVTETKNATSAGFVTTKLRVTSDVPADIIAKIKTALIDTYENIVLEPLTDTTVKIEIIIGKKK